MRATLLVILVLAAGCGKRNMGEERIATAEGEMANPSGGAGATPIIGGRTTDTEPAAAEFNPKDSAETVRWLAVEARRIRLFDSKGNEFVNGSKESLLEKVKSVPKGKRIQWPVPVSKVSEKGVVQSSFLYQWPQQIDPESTRSVTVLALRLWPENTSSVPQWKGTAEQLRVLKPGDLVILAALVRNGELETTRVPLKSDPLSFRMDSRWTFTVEDVSYQPTK